MCLILSLKLLFDLKILLRFTFVVTYAYPLEKGTTELKTLICIGYLLDIVNEIDDIH